MIIVKLYRFDKDVIDELRGQNMAKKGSSCMLKVVKSPSNTSNIFFENIQKSEDTIILCAPFIKTEIVNNILRQKKSSTKIKLITSNSLGPFKVGARDIEAIEQIIKDGHEVYFYKNLHSKVYIFDNKSVMVTSANLTNAGFYRNYEYGIYSDNELVDEVNTEFNNILDDKEVIVKCGLKELGDLKEQIEIIKLSDTSVIIDNEDVLLNKDDCNIIVNSFKGGWKKTILELLILNDLNEFTLQDLNKYEEYLKEKHPDNNNIKPKIRQILQQLRDIGLIEFLGHGHYRKLWL